MFGRFSGDFGCAAACHKFDDGQLWNEELAMDLKANQELLTAPPMDAVCRITGQFGRLRSAQKIIIAIGKPFPFPVQPCPFRFGKMEADDLGGGGVPIPAFRSAAVPDVQSFGSFILFGMIFAVTQEGDHIPGLDRITSGLFPGVAARNKAGVQKILRVPLADMGDAVELVFGHTVWICFKDFIAL